MEFLKGRLAPDATLEAEKEMWEADKEWKAPCMAMMMFINIMAMAALK